MKKQRVAFIGMVSVILLFILIMNARNNAAIHEQNTDYAIPEIEYIVEKPFPDREYYALVTEDNRLRYLTDEEYQYLLTTEFDGNTSIIDHLNTRMQKDLHD